MEDKWKTSSNLKTFGRGLKEDFNPANKSDNQPNKKLKFNHSSLALKLNAQNANGPLESAFLFAHDQLWLVTYVKKGKQARIQEKQTLNVTSGSWFFHLILKWYS